MNRAIYDRSKPTKNLVTTITGIVTLLISALSLFEVLTAEQGAELTGYVTTIVTAIAGVIAIFKSEDSAINLPRGKGKHVAVILVLLAMSSVNLQAQDTGLKAKIKGFWRPVTAADLNIGDKAINGTWKIRPTATLVATSYSLKFTEEGKYDGFTSEYLSKTGLGVSYAHYIVSEGEAISNYSVNALLLLGTNDDTDIAVAATFSALKFVNAGVGYNIVKGEFKNNLFFLSGISLVF